MICLLIWKLFVLIPFPKVIQAISYPWQSDKSFGRLRNQRVPKTIPDIPQLQTQGHSCQIWALPSPPTPDCWTRIWTPCCVESGRGTLGTVSWSRCTCQDKEEDGENVICCALLVYIYVVFLQERGHSLTSWFTMPWRTVLKKLLAMQSWDFFVVHHGKWLRVSVTVFVWDIWHAGEKQKKLLIHEWFPTVLIVSLTALICQAFYLFECSSCPLHDAVISVVILPIKAFTIGELHGFSDWNLQINHIPGSNVLICTELDKMKNWKIFINSLTTDSTGPIQ